MTSKSWTEEEDEIIKENADLNWQEIQKILPHRSKHAIHIRRSKLGVSRASIITEEDKDYIRENYFDMTSREIAKKLGVEKTTVNRHAKNMGLKKFSGEWDITEIGSEIINGETNISFVFEMRKEFDQ